MALGRIISLMCGRYSQTHSWEELHGWFKLIGPALNLAPRYNIAPTQDVTVIRMGDDGHHASPMRWGLVPSWAKDVSIGARMINARSETIAEKPSFRTAFKKRRCLIPADGFYEWTGPKGDKQPHRIVVDDGALFAFAGLWETWDKEGIESCTIITCEPNVVTRPIHNRMPVILARNDYDGWLEGDDGELLRPYPPDTMTSYQVSREVNNARNDTPECVEPL